jgi:hypothetical protein
MPIRRKRHQLANGEERTYTYNVTPQGQYEQLSVISSDSSSASGICYRSAEKKRIVAALLANSSILVVSGTGAGKTFLAEAVTEDLQAQGFLTAAPKIGTAKQILMSIAESLNVDTETLEGKAMNTQQLQETIANWLSHNTAFLILDNAHRFPTAIRCWLEKLHLQNQPMLLLATFPPARDIFIKLPRIELEPLSDSHIREIMIMEADSLGLKLKPVQLAGLQQRTGNNPMLAKRAIKEEYLGLEGNNDNTNWIDGTPYLIGGLMCFMILRFLGLGFNNTTLYLMGGILTVAVGIVRIMIFSLPRQGSKLGQ